MKTLIKSFLILMLLFSPMVSQAQDTAIVRTVNPLFPNYEIKNDKEGIGYIEINKDTLIKLGKLSHIDKNIQIISFIMSNIKDGFFVEVFSKSNLFSDDIIMLIYEASIGSPLYIEYIKAINSEGEKINIGSLKCIFIE